MIFKTVFFFLKDIQELSYSSPFQRVKSTASDLILIFYYMNFVQMFIISSIQQFMLGGFIGLNAFT